MAAGVNKVILVGNLGRDPEVRYTQSGNAVCNINLAVTERVKDGEGWKDATEWFRVVTFGKTAENAGQYLQKGRQIYVEGRLRTSKYKDKEGNERTSTEVLANTVQFLGSGQGRPGGGAPREGAPRETAAPRDAGPVDDAPVGDGGGFIDDDLPF